jgi:hypothetical protein
LIGVSAGVVFINENGGGPGVRLKKRESDERKQLVAKRKTSTMQKLRSFARGASVYIKIAAALAGICAAWFWYQSAVASDEAAIDLNTWAALTTGLSMLLQSISAGIDAWIAPTALFA